MPRGINVHSDERQFGGLRFAPPTLRKWADLELTGSISCSKMSCLGDGYVRTVGNNPVYWEASCFFLSFIFTG